MRINEIKIEYGANRFSNRTSVHNSIEAATEKVNFILDDLKKESFLSPMEYIKFYIEFSTGFKGSITFPITTVRETLPVNDLKQVIITSLERLISNIHNSLHNVVNLFEVSADVYPPYLIDSYDILKESTEFLICMKKIDSE